MGEEERWSVIREVEGERRTAAQMVRGERRDGCNNAVWRFVGDVHCRVFVERNQV